MKKKQIEKEYKEKIQKLIKFNKFYYDHNNPLINDREYDNLKEDILNLENKYSYLKNKNSPSLVVGFKPSKNFKKVSHKVPMLSLANAFDEEDLINFEKKNYELFEPK